MREEKKHVTGMPGVESETFVSMGSGRSRKHGPHEKSKDK